MERKMNESFIYNKGEGLREKISSTKPSLSDRVPPIGQECLRKKGTIRRRSQNKGKLRFPKEKEGTSLHLVTSARGQS